MTLNISRSILWTLGLVLLAFLVGCHIYNPRSLCRSNLITPFFQPNLVAVTNTFGCAVHVGRIHCWGDNGTGGLGDGTNTTNYTPRFSTNLEDASAVVTSMTGSACAVVGCSIKCWGSNSAGEIGDGTNTTRLSPVGVYGLSDVLVTGLTGSELQHYCAIINGGAKCWGNNGGGQLGDGTMTSRNRPVDVVGLTSGVQYIDGGFITTCAVINGAAKCWGSNAQGAIGDGQACGAGNCLTAQQVSGLTSGVTAVSSGGDFIYTEMFGCALVNGGVKCWGSNGHGQLGDGTTTPSTTPVQVSGMTSGVTAISSGNAHTCVIKNGAAWCWGDNTTTQMGDGGACASPCKTPVQVPGLSSGVTGIYASGLVGAGNMSCAVVNGVKKCWGSNGFGNLGTGSPVPVTVTSPTNLAL